MARTFPWSRCYQKLNDALRDQISDATPLACIWEDARIGSYANSSRDSFSIDNAAIQAIKNCLNGDLQGRNRDTGTAVTVSGYTVDGKQYTLKLKINGDDYALEGPWGSIMQENRWSKVTEICFWGFPYGGRNSGAPCLVFTYNI